MSAENHTDSHFPNATFAGIALVLACFSLAVGSLLRVDINFFFPEQIKAFVNEPSKMQISYSCYIIGWVLMFPSMIILSKQISASKPVIGNLAGIMVLLGLFKRAFNAGSDYMAFLWIKAEGAEMATQGIANTYGTINVFHIITPMLMAGWIILAIGAYITKKLAWWQCIGLLLTVAMPVGVLKGTATRSLVSLLGICLAFIPYGMYLIKSDKQNPSKVMVWLCIALAVIAVSSFVGIFG